MVNYADKMKASTLKEMFWSRSDVYNKYMNHGPLSSSDESSEDDEEAGDHEEESDDDRNSSGDNDGEVR